MVKEKKYYNSHKNSIKTFLKKSTNKYFKGTR